MNSDQVKSGVERAPHRSLLKADGYSDEQIRRPFVVVVNSFNEIAPGHVHLQTIARAVKDGVLAAGGTPMEFNTIGVCDGIAMGHKGIKLQGADRGYHRMHGKRPLLRRPGVHSQLRQDRAGNAHGGLAPEPPLYLRVRRPHALHWTKRLKFRV